MGDIREKLAADCLHVTHDFLRPGFYAYDIQQNHYYSDRQQQNEDTREQNDILGPLLHSVILLDQRHLSGTFLLLEIDPEIL